MVLQVTLILALKQSQYYFRDNFQFVLLLEKPRHNEGKKSFAKGPNKCLSLLYFVYCENIEGKADLRIVLGDYVNGILSSSMNLSRAFSAEQGTSRVRWRKISSERICKNSFLWL